MDEKTLSEITVPASEIELDSDGGDENTTESAAETEHNEHDPSHQGENTDDANDNVPFHDHPRFVEITKANKALISDNKAVREQLESLKQTQESMNAVIQAMKGGDIEELDPAYVEMIGNDDKAKDFYKFLSELVDKGVDKTLTAKQQAEQKKLEEAKQKKAEWQSVVERQYEEIGDSKVTKEELTAIAKEFSGNGYIVHLKDAYKIWQERNSRNTDSDKSDKMKAAARMSGSGDKSGSTGDKAVSLEDIRKKSWDSWRT